MKITRIQPVSAAHEGTDDIAEFTDQDYIERIARHAAITACRATGQFPQARSEGIVAPIILRIVVDSLEQTCASRRRFVASMIGYFKEQRERKYFPLPQNIDAEQACLIMGIGKDDARLRRAGCYGILETGAIEMFIEFRIGFTGKTGVKRPGDFQR